MGEQVKQEAIRWFLKLRSPDVGSVDRRNHRKWLEEDIAHQHAYVWVCNEWEDFEDIHTVTMYVGAVRQDAYYDKIISLEPKRVLFNPGTENPDFQTKLIKAGIEVEEACTLVLLSLKNY